MPGTKLTQKQKLAIGGITAVLVLILLFVIEDRYNRPLLFSLPTLYSILLGFIGGALLAGLLILGKYVFTRHGKTAALVGLVLLIVVGDFIGPRGLSAVTSGLGGFIGFITGLVLVLSRFVKVTPPTKLPHVFGSSRWSTFLDLQDWGLLGKREDTNGLFLGEEPNSGEAIVYGGDMHALTVAPTRTGKGATAIIPNLLRSNSSILVIDPKGENARRTLARRIEMGQKAYVVDPWGISTQSDRYGHGIDPQYIAGSNPLELLNPEDPDLASDVMLLADALVIAAEKDPFWSDEAKALIHGFILYVVTEASEQDNRNLARVRDILSLPPATENDEDLTGTLDEILLNMAGSDHHLVRAAAFRLMQKAEKERSGVISSAQANTHFLDSPKIRESLSQSDFRFSDLKSNEDGITVYLVLPLDRLPTFHRWLRLLVTSALIDLTRAPTRPDAPPVRVILDEFAALQKLSLIETAYGTMAGLGVQLWVLTQDLGQLMKLYGDKSWQTFVSNAGVFQYFGSRDYETAKYAEHLCGMTTMKKRSFSIGTSSSSATGPQGGSSTSSGSSETISHDDVSRPLAYADEMMTLHRDLQILFIENRYPIIAQKWWWFSKIK